MAERIPPPAPHVLTSAEALIWRGQRLDPRSPLYNMALAIEVEGEIDLERLGEALSRVVQHADAMRTVYVEHGGRPHREVLSRVDGPLEILDRPEGRFGDDDVEAELTARTRRIFALDRPLFDICAIRRSDHRTVLYINQHHLITDAWATALLYHRWADEYADQEAGRADGARRYPPYEAHVRRQAELAGSARMQRARAYWSKRPSPRRDFEFYGGERTGSGRTDRTRLPLGEERAAKLRAIAADAPFGALTAEQSRFQVFATLLFAWMARVTGERELAIGIPLRNRPRQVEQDTLGLFIELYPLSVSVDADETFCSLASKVSAATMSLMRHAVPGASASPGAQAFGVVLNYITAGLGDFAGRPARANWIHSGHGDPVHRMRLQVHDFDADGCPTLDFDLDVAAFDGPARAWAVEHLVDLFDALGEDADQPIAGVALTDWTQEADRVDAPGDPPVDSVLSMFRSSVEAAPQRVAVVDGDASVTFAELAERAGRLARALRAEGVQRGETVGVLVEPSADLVVALLGTLEAGAAFTPLDPAHPRRRLGAVLADGDVSLVLASGRTADLASGFGRPTATVADLVGRADRAGSDRWAPEGAALAYVLYTSGSTGEPKGVEVEHGSLAGYVSWAAGAYADSAGLRFPLFTSIAFDLTLTSIFVPLASGGTIVVYRGQPGNEGMLVRRVFQDSEVDVVKLTPSHLGLIRDLDLSGSRVRTLIVGGEDLKAPTAAAARAALGPGVEIYNEYGPTETTVACTLHRYDPEADTCASVPIGRPIANARIHVVDERGRPALPGRVGEICVAGPGVARGYRNRRELTDQAFVTDPLHPDRRMYRTGDRGRWRRDGTLEFLGRRDDQVKLRGVRIELGEVEAALAGHPSVRGAVARMFKAAGEDGGNCARCGLEAAHPEAQLDQSGVCALCRRFERERDRVASYFGTMGDLTRLLGEARELSTGEHDTLMLYSGGKDSTYALCRVVELGANPLVFLMDNGFISEEAKTNVRRVVDELGLELVIGETPAMTGVFADSLRRFSNVCQGCFKVIYTLAMNLAVERGISTIVTGLSRGQIFETRLADLYRRGIFDPSLVDGIILEARKAYHRMDDEVSRSLDVSIFETDDALDRIRFLDFFRYCDDTLDEMLGYLARRTPWIRPSDTGRSTNCLINQAGIWVHKRERGFHNYGLPYSWDVRLGHKTRDAAVEELDDALDPSEVRRLLDAVGYAGRPPRESDDRLVAFYTADAPVPAGELRAFLGDLLPREAIPTSFVRLDDLPLAPSGKVDRDALPRPGSGLPVVEEAFRAPASALEVALASLWCEILGLETVGADDDFFELGGDSMHCIQIVSAARLKGWVFEPRDLFANPTISALAEVVSTQARGPASAASATTSELAELEAQFGGG